MRRLRLLGRQQIRNFIKTKKLKDPNYVANLSAKKKARINSLSDSSGQNFSSNNGTTDDHGTLIIAYSSNESNQTISRNNEAIGDRKSSIVSSSNGSSKNEQLIGQISTIGGQFKDLGTTITGQVQEMGTTLTGQFQDMMTTFITALKDDDNHGGGDASAGNDAGAGANAGIDAGGGIVTGSGSASSEKASDSVTEKESGSSDPYNLEEGELVEESDSTEVSDNNDSRDVSNDSDKASTSDDSSGLEEGGLVDEIDDRKVHLAETVKPPMSKSNSKYPGVSVNESSLTVHAHTRMFERGIFYSDVKRTIASGKIIRFNGPKRTLELDGLIVIVALDHETKELRVVTAYYVDDSREEFCRIPHDQEDWAVFHKSRKFYSDQVKEYKEIAKDYEEIEKEHKSLKYQLAESEREASYYRRSYYHGDEEYYRLCEGDDLYRTPRKRRRYEPSRTPTFRTP